MSIRVPGSPTPVRQPFVLSTLKQNAAASAISLDSVDTFSSSSNASHAQPAPLPALRFGGWTAALPVLLPLVKAGLSMGRDHLDNSMKRDEYERNKRQRYFKKGPTSYEDRGNKYRKITMMKAYDGNDTRKHREDYETAGPWIHRTSRPSRRHRY